MTRLPAVDPNSTPDVRAACLGTLSLHVRAHQLDVELHDDMLKVSHPDRPDCVVEVRCGRRAADGGRLWFEVGGKPLAEADHFTETLTEIKGLVSARRM